MMSSTIKTNQPIYFSIDSAGLTANLPDVKVQLHIPDGNGQLYGTATAVYQ